MRKTFTEALQARGIKDPQLRSVAWHNARQSLMRPVRSFPEFRDVTHRALIEAQAPGGLTVCEPIEFQDEVVFSGRGLTDWYVREFQRLNHLKG